MVRVAHFFDSRCRNEIAELSQRAPPKFGWAVITLGIGPHSSFGPCSQHSNNKTLSYRRENAYCFRTIISYGNMIEAFNILTGKYDATLLPINRFA